MLLELSSGLLQLLAIWNINYRVKNETAHLICNVGRFELITPSLYMLHWLPADCRIQFKFFSLYIKSSTVSLLFYIFELVELKPASRYNLRNSDDTLLLNNPSIKSRITSGDRSFKYAGLKLCQHCTPYSSKNSPV